MAQVLSTGKQRAGKTSRILVGATALTYASWDVDMSIDIYPTTNFESYNVADAQSYDEGISGILKAGLNGGGDWDAGTNPFGSPPALYPQDSLANLLFYISRLDNTFYTFTYARIASAKVGSNVTNKITFSFNGNSQGRFTYPTLSV